MTNVPLERKVKEKLRLWLREQRAYVFCPVQTGYGSTTLDFLVCISGVFYAFETKRAGADLTPRQKIVAQQIKAAGGKVYKVTLNGAEELVFEDVAR